MDKGKSEIEKAKELINTEKNKRAQEFASKLQELCKEYNCTLEVGQIIIKAN